MTRLRSLRACLLAAALAGETAALGQTPALRKPATRDAVSEAVLQQRVSASVKLDKVLSAKSRPVGEERPAVQSSLWGSSVILSDGVHFTLVPAGSILNLPEMHRHRILEKPEGSFTFWPAFLRRNAAWLAAKEVPLRMAQGDAKPAQAVLQETSKDGRVVVAVHRGGPITILEPAPPSTKLPGNANP